MNIFPDLDEQKLREFTASRSTYKDYNKGSFSSRKQVTLDSNSNPHGKRKSTHESHHLNRKDSFLLLIDLKSNCKNICNCIVRPI